MEIPGIPHGWALGVAGLLVSFHLPAQAGGQETPPRPPHPGPEFCVTDPAPTLGPGHPFPVRVGWARGERGGEPAWVLVEEVTILHGLPFRMVGSGCTWYVVDFELPMGEEREEDLRLLPPPTGAHVAGLVEALRVVAPYHVGGVRVGEVADRLESLLEEALREGGAASDLLGQEVPVGDNELGEWFVLAVTCPQEVEDLLSRGCALRLRAVVGL